MIIREAKLSDIDAIMNVEENSFISPIQEAREVFLERIEVCKGLFLIFEEEGKVAGYLSAEILPKLPTSAEELQLGHIPNKSTCNSPLSIIYISSFALHPVFRGSGLGKCMWNESIDYLKSRFPNKAFLLLVNEEWKGAKHIYEQSGFEVINIFDNFFPSLSGKNTNAILMKKEI